MTTIRIPTCAKLACLAAILTGCATQTLPSAPEALRAPSDQVLTLQTPATGVQIYECAVRPAHPSGYEWVFNAPEAQLFDKMGRVLGRHYGGPTWEASDGSKVVGEVKARDDTNTAAIPLLLLSAKSTQGSGLFSQIKTIQRLQTVGGNPPVEPCSSNNVGKIARVPYQAVYYFYAAKP